MRAPTICSCGGSDLPRGIRRGRRSPRGVNAATRYAKVHAWDSVARPALQPAALSGMRQLAQG
eukprot:7948150-Lingulodinium_polyedra.AAC.1